jgi:sugar phosphate isomerase/epimerase
VKVVLQLGLIPGSNTADKAKWAQDHGVEGIELGVWGGMDAMQRDAEAINGIVPVTSVCGNATPDGERGFDFLHPEKSKRRASIDGSKKILEFCGQVGAVGQIVPPIFGAPVVPDLSPWKTPLEIEEELMIEACKEIGPFAAEHKVLFMLEPLNRYEQHYLRKQSDGVRIIEAARAAGVQSGIGLLSDFFHMHIEETSTPQTFREIGQYTNHIHLADNTRMEPGTGDIDFVAGFKALKEVEFDGYMAYECSISGDSPAAKEQNLIKSLQYVRDCIAKA